MDKFFDIKKVKSQEDLDMMVLEAYRTGKANAWFFATLTFLGISLLAWALSL